MEHNEDETFRRLKRTPMNQVWAEYEQILSRQFFIGSNAQDELLNNLCEKHGWDRNDFQKAMWPDDEDKGTACPPSA